MQPVVEPGFVRNHLQHNAALNFGLRARNKRAVKRLRGLFDEHILDARHQVRADRLDHLVDDIAFRITPLRSFEAQRPLMFFSAATHQRLPVTYPLRTVVNVYNGVVNELWWLMQ